MDNSKQETNTTPSHFGIKRRRVILSCLECKRRKLKCDRSTPACARCRQIGRAEHCSYDQRFSRSSEGTVGENDAVSVDQGAAGTSTLSAPSHDTDARQVYLPTPLEPSPGDEVSKSDDEPMSTQQLIEQNLPRIANQMDGGSPPPRLDRSHNGNNEPGSSHTRQAPDHIIFRGKGFKTQFYGASHHWYPVGVLSNFHDVHHYFRDVLEQEPTLASLARLIPSLRNTTKAAEHAERALNAPVNLPLLLPDRATCQSLMELFFQYYGCIYSVIHRPLFWRQFADYWAGRLESPLPFVAVMLVAMACSRCLRLDDVARYEGSSSAGREQATTWINAADKWLSQQSHKHTTIVDFQVPCLLLEARRTNSIKIKRNYGLAQALLSRALTAGFHRDPAELGPDTTPFDGEMRRRVWSIVREFELGAAVARGLPAMSPGFFSSNEPPANVGDEDMIPDGDIRQVQPDSVFTESSYLRFADKTRALRNEINNLVNDPKRHVLLPYSAILDYHAQLTACINKVPSWTTAAAGVGSDSKIAKGLAGLKLRKMLFVLHLPFAAQQSEDPSVKHSRFVCHEVAYDMLQIHKEASEGGMICPLFYTRSDVVRAGISICLMKMDRPQVQDAILLEMQRRFQTDQMESVLELVEARILRLGVGLKGYWMLLAASCFEEATREGPTLTTWRKKVVDRCAALYYKLAAAQPPRAPSASVGTEVSGRLGATTEMLLEGSGPQPNVAGFDMSFGDMGGLGWPEWSFDDMELFCLTDA